MKNKVGSIHRFVYLCMSFVFFGVLEGSFAVTEDKGIDSKVIFSADVETSQGNQSQDSQKVTPLKSAKKETALPELVSKASSANKANGEGELDFPELVNEDGYQVQPLVTVKDTSIKESNAAKLRRKREEAEIRTEQKIAESLEKARLADEAKRANRLFGGKIAPAHEDKPAPVQAPTNYSEQLDAIRHDLQNIKGSSKTHFEDEFNFNSAHISGIVGVGNYPSSVGLDGEMLFGFSTGAKVGERRFQLDGHLVFSRYRSKDGYGFRDFSRDEEYDYVQVDQYNIGLSLKYDLFPFVVTPRVGGVVDYVFRRYSRETDFFNRTGTLDTHAVDAGVILGGYADISDSIGLEVNYRHMRPVTQVTRVETFDGYPTLRGFSYSVFGVSLQIKL